jgi:hypothetical protein
VSPHGRATDAAPRQVTENEADNLVLFVCFGEAAAAVGSASLTGRAWTRAASSLPPAACKAVGLALR